MVRFASCRRGSWGPKVGADWEGEGKHWVPRGWRGWHLGWGGTGLGRRGWKDGGPGGEMTHLQRTAKQVGWAQLSHSLLSGRVRHQWGSGK